ncbi:hypothetical protein [Streptomyces sp. SM11]|uniref:hypothetical protein n=1 Tax=Streptomyces sp. SM11 TaxID=565557 RepID=UPI0015E16A4B|nr:hypothetical protein [Streptomyces sp. SM11]
MGPRGEQDAAAAVEDPGQGISRKEAAARAPALRPRLMICDEPVSARDLTTQRTVLEQLQEIPEQSGVVCLFVTHDLGVIRCMSHRWRSSGAASSSRRDYARRVTSDPRHPCYPCADARRTRRGAATAAA